jgi:hypothetical protein
MLLIFLGGTRTQRAGGNKKVHLFKYRMNLHFLPRPKKATHLSLYYSIFYFFNFIYTIYINRKSDTHTIIHRLQPLPLYTHISIL